MSVLRKIELPPSVRDQIAERLRTSIVDGSLKPGTRLVERELCEQLGVSRPSVREAMRQLENEGLITNVPNRGPIVTAVSGKAAADIYQVRSALEGLAARLFARNASDADMAAMQRCWEELQKMSGSPPLEYLAVKDRFYSILLKGCGNELVAQFGGIALRRFYQLRSISVSRTDRAEESRKEVKKLVDALLARDEEAAARACVEHVENTARAVFRALDKLSAEGA